MPTSSFSQLTEIIRLIVLTDPMSILDVGVGFGKYGFLSREYLEFWDGREKYDVWTRRLDGIEVFRPYLTPVHDFIYDHIYIGNALDILPTLETHYDLILLADVIEHFEYEEGMRLLDECRKRGRNIIISTPRDIGHQKDSFGNPFETHRFQWEEKHFTKFGTTLFVPAHSSFICYVGDDLQKVREVPQQRALEARVAKWLHLLAAPYRVIRRIRSAPCR